MRLPYLILSILLIVNAAVDVYIYLALRTYFKRAIWSKIQAWSAVALALVLIAIMLIPVRDAGNNVLLLNMWLLFSYISIYVAKYIFVIFDVLSRLPMLMKKHRWKWMTSLGTGLAVAVFVSFWWGALINRFSLDTKEVTITDRNLPASFDGLRIVQISDMHLGTYGRDTAFISKMVNHINGMKPDLVLFTGDIVNRNTTEMYPFMKPLSRLKAKYGVYSVLGNHDYGDYENWPTEAAKKKNLDDMKRLQGKMRWRLLNNETAVIANGGDTIRIIGVENVGDPPFTVYGNLQEAYPTIGDNKFKILLSHNPAHWDEDIEDNAEANVNLTLSGHTHAMQMEALGVSPSAMRYRHWGGLYTDNRGQNLYVNIGTGTVGMPTRIGATPEITLITLKK